MSMKHVKNKHANPTFSIVSIPFRLLILMLQLCLVQHPEQLFVSKKLDGAALSWIITRQETCPIRV